MKFNMSEIKCSRASEIQDILRLALFHGTVEQILFTVELRTLQRERGRGILLDIGADGQLLSAYP